MAGTACLSATRIYPTDAENTRRPNILWITSEDNSPMLGCYGDAYATTPNLDRLAAEGILYENAFANAPVCAPARFTILTGLYASAMGTHHMRSRYPVPSFVKPLPQYLHNAGYFCTNREKTDYNFKTEDKTHWDECGPDAGYQNRQPGQPFFSIINLTTSHESSIHKPAATTNHDPATVTLPPYHPDTPEIRHDWAQYYDKVQDMDRQVGQIFEQLNRDGLSEDTIVFYYADHGGILCRSKRFLYDTGTHVPLIIRFPEKYRHLAPGEPGTKTDRLVSFVDLAPTIMSLVGIKIPDYIQGKAFLGDQQQEPGKTIHLFRGRMDERIDMMRAVRDKQYKYIRNYMPHRIYGQHIEYLWRAPATRSWEKAYRQGRCNKVQSIFWQPKPPEELYDIKQDPWEVNNLANDPDYSPVLEKMRKENMRWVRAMHDPGFISEGEMTERTHNTTAFDLVHQHNFPMERIIEAAEIASERNVKYCPELIRRLEDDESAVRFWAATGCAILSDQALPAVANLTKALNDGSADVRIAAAEALCRISQSDAALEIITSELANENDMIQLHAANALDALGNQAMPALTAMKQIQKTRKNEDVKKALAYTISKLEKSGSRIKD